MPGFESQLKSSSSSSPLNPQPYPPVQRHHRNSPSLSAQRQPQVPHYASSPLSLASDAAGLTSVPLNGPTSAVPPNLRLRIYPKEFGPRPRLFPSGTPQQANSPSPLLSALSNPSELFSFLSTSNPRDGTTASSASSIAGGGSSPPSSWPASFSPAGARGFQPGSRGNGNGYLGFEESLKGAYNARGGYAHAAQAAQPSLKPGDGGSCCVFDTLDDGAGGENALLLGWHGGLDVFKLGRNVLELVGRLEGLTGTVVDAKIIPAIPRDDPFAADRPLVAVVLHSPIPHYPANGAATPPSPALSGIPPRPGSSASARGGTDEASLPSEWITSVEVYSIAAKRRVCTLFTGPPTSASDFPGAVGPPPPWGGLRMQVGPRNVVIGCGLSGEVYVFGLTPHEKRPKRSSALAPVPAQVGLPSLLDESPPQEPAAAAGKKKKKSSKSKASPPERVESPAPMQLPPPLPVPVAHEEPMPKPEWICLAKVWTALQVPPDAQQQEGSAGIVQPFTGVDGRSLTPIFSLEGRWLAYVPPSANSSIAAGGNVGVPVPPSATLSVNSQSPPNQPPINCAVDASNGETWTQKLKREAGRELIRGAKWGMNEGIKMVRNYWENGNNGSPSPPNQGMSSSPGYAASASGASVSAHSMARYGSTYSLAGGQPGVSGLGQQLQQHRQSLGSSSPYGNSYAPAPAVQTLGPQYARPPMHRNNDPVMVSILDLGKPLSDATVQNPLGSLVNPMASFVPGSGVSFLSFAPGGLFLLTASSKGDVISIWDLMRSVQQSHKPLAASEAVNGRPTETRMVRRVAIHTRVTVAHVVSVNWSHPEPSKIAVLTDRGTVHFYELPSDAFRWPPPPKPIAPPPSSPSVNAQNTANAAIKGAVNFINSNAQPLISSAQKLRRTSMAISAPSPSSSSSSVGGMFMPRSASSDRRSVSNPEKKPPPGGSKVPLPPGTAPREDAVKFLIGKERGYVALLGATQARIYELRKSSSSSSAGRRKRRKGRQGGNAGVVPGNWLEFEMPLLPDGWGRVMEGYEERARDGREDALVGIDLGAREPDVGGFWLGRGGGGGGDAREGAGGAAGQVGNWNPLSEAEIETNAVYRPFHADRRVTISVFESSTTAATTTTAAVAAGAKKKKKKEKGEKTSGKPSADTLLPGLADAPLVSFPANPSEEEEEQDEEEGRRSVAPARAKFTSPDVPAVERWVFGGEIAERTVSVAVAEVGFEWEGEEGGYEGGWEVLEI